MSITIVQSAVSADIDDTATFGSGLTSGNTLLIVAANYAVGFTATEPVQFEIGATQYTVPAAFLGEASAGTDSLAYSAWLVPIGGGMAGATNLGFTVIGSGPLKLYGVELSDAATITLDQSLAATATGTAAYATGTVTTAFSDELAFFAIAGFNSVPSSGVSGAWTQIGTSNEMPLWYQNAVASSTGLSLSGSMTATADWASALFTLYAAASGSTVALTAPNLALAAPVPSVSAGATVALTAPNLALAAPLLSPKAGATVALTAPNVALTAPLPSVSAGATVALTAPNVALAAPLVSASSGGTPQSVSLTAPNLALAAPLPSVKAGATVALTAPNLALAAPLVSASSGAVVALTAPGLALAAPALTVGAGGTLALTAPGVALAAPVLAVTAGGRVALTAPGITLAAPPLGLGSPQQGTASITLAASYVTISNALAGSVTIVNDL